MKMLYGHQTWTEHVDNWDKKIQGAYNLQKSIQVAVQKTWCHVCMKRAAYTKPKRARAETRTVVKTHDHTLR